MASFWQSTLAPSMRPACKAWAAGLALRDLCSSPGEARAAACSHPGSACHALERAHAR